MQSLIDLHVLKALLTVMFVILSLILVIDSARSNSSASAKKENDKYEGKE